MNDIMIDREKVIQAVENCIGQPKCKDCPWEECNYEHEVINSVPYSLMRNTLAMLKDDDNQIHHMKLIIEELEKELGKRGKE